MNLYLFKAKCITFFCCLLLSQTLLFAQSNIKITLKKTNITLREVFIEIEKQAKMPVAYNESQLGGKHISLNIENQSLDQSLKIILKGTTFGYKISNGYIIIAPEEKPVESPKNYKGRVVDGAGEPLIGVNIKILGTSAGAITDMDGYFTLLAQKGDLLEVSYIGYGTQTLTISEKKPLNIVLKEDTEMLNEVVVTALGIKKETKALTYNVQEVKGSEIVRIKDANFMSSLSGKIAGVTINMASSGVGGSARVVMRGTKSITSNNNALYVIDGIPMPNLSSTQPSDMYTGMGQSGDGVSMLNPDDIESMSALTGAAAAALYGSDAANGVILVTTKKGTSGKMSINVSNSTTFSSPFVLPEFQNTYGSEMGEYSSWGQKHVTPTDYAPVDFFQTGFNVNNSISLSTGTETNQTYFSASTVNARGVIHNNDLDRYNFTVRNSSDMLNDRLHMDLSFMYVRTNEQNMLSQGQYFNPLVPIYLFPRGDDIAKYQTFERYNASRNFKTQYWPYGDQGMMMQNPYWITERDMFNNKKDRFLASIGLKYDITDWMNISARVKYDGTRETRTKKYYASTATLFAGSDMGAYYKDEAATTQIYADAMLNVDRYIGDFSVRATLGASLCDVQYNYSSLGGPLHSTANLFSYVNLNKNGIRLAQNGYHDHNQAVFATAQTGYKSMVYLDLTGRNDWPSALAGTVYKNKGFFYYSVGASALLADLLSINSDVLSFMKARVSYSEVGNAPIRFIPISTYTFQASGYPETNKYSVDKALKPERTHAWEVGLNTKLFGNKISLDLTLYTSSTYNQLFSPEVSIGEGSTSYYVNAGRVDNKGIEVTLGLNQDLGRVNWTSNLTYSINKNEVKELLPATTTPEGLPISSMSEMIMSGTDNYRMVLKEGRPMGDIYVNTLKTDEHGYIIVDIISQKVTADPDRFVYAGNANPNYTLGWRNNFSWKNFDFGFLINGRFGGIGVSATQAKIDAYGVSIASAEARDNGGALVNGERIPAKDYYQTIGGGTSGIGAMYVYDATNIRLAEVSLGYDIPVNKWVKWLQGAHVSVVGRNLFMLYNKAPFDPESTASTGTYFQGIDYFMQPSLRNVGFSVNLKF